jgi:hypothetical protein
MNMFDRLTLQHHSFQTLSTGYWWTVTFTAWEKPRINLGLGQTTVFILVNRRTCHVWDYISGRPLRSYSLCCQNFAMLPTDIYILLKILCESGMCKIKPKLWYYVAPNLQFYIIHATKFIRLLEGLRDIRCGSVTSRFLGLWVGIPPCSMHICLWCVILLSRGLCVRPITRPEES